MRLGLALALTFTIVGCGRIGFDGPHDGSVHDGSVIDASDDAFAIPDGPAGSRTETWGEGQADHTNVTIDTFVSGLSSPVDQRDMNFGAATSFAFSEGVALLRFDLRAIAPSATVVAAYLRVAITNPGSISFSIHRVLETWDEGNGNRNVGVASWNQRTPGVAWTNPGVGSPGSAATSALATIRPGMGGSVQLNTADVQEWVSSPAANHGIVLYPSENNDTFIASREAASSTTRPLLTIVYLP